MGLRKRLFKDYMGSYISKFDLDESVPSLGSSEQNGLVSSLG
jgi:hypothetical protein